MANLVLVEDDLALLDGLEEYLMLSGHNVLALDSAKRAITALASVAYLPDLIISDVMMPDMTGIEMLKIVRGQEKWADIPFLFVSASTTLTMEGELQSYERVAFVRKPFDPQKLLEAVNEMLAG